MEKGRKDDFGSGGFLDRVVEIIAPLVFAELEKLEREVTC